MRLCIPSLKQIDCSFYKLRSSMIPCCNPWEIHLWHFKSQNFGVCHSWLFKGPTLWLIEITVLLREMSGDLMTSPEPCYYTQLISWTTHSHLEISVFLKALHVWKTIFCISVSIDDQYCYWWASSSSRLLEHFFFFVFNFHFSLLANGP